MYFFISDFILYHHDYSLENFQGIIWLKLVSMTKTEYGSMAHFQ